MRKRKVKRTAPKRFSWTSIEGWRKRLNPHHLKEYWFSREGLIMVGRIFGAGFLLIFLIFLYFAKDLPSPNKLNAIVSAQTTKFYDRTGQTLLYEVYGNKNRTLIDFSQMPQDIRDATIAVEDKNFYHEGAFSFIGYLRAAFYDLLHHGIYQGGSTITQQYVKNALLDPNDRSFGRKIKELILSIEISQFYSKNDILKLYLNEIPYGSNAYGIEAASKTFFQKDAKDLTLPEASLLAALPNAPTYYSPYGEHRDALIERQHLILDLMAQQGYISQQQADDAKKVDVLSEIPPVQNLYANITAPHFVLYTEEQLENKYGFNYVTEGGLKVITTLDLKKQQEAEQAITTNMPRVRAYGGSNAALVAADPNNGQVLAMVGSYSFSDPKFGAFNVATAERQPGSSFKPFVFATAWGKNFNWGPGSTMYNVPTDFGGGYKPHNYPGDPTNSVESMRSSLGNSLNVPAVKTLYIVGVQNALDTAHSMGITTLNQSPSHYGLSLVLGSGDVKLYDMVNAYESFANMGVHYQPTTVLKITDSSGKVIEDNTKPQSPTRVLDPQVAYLMDNVLSDVNAKRPAFNPDLGYFTYPGRQVAAKTGTTENFNDAWTMGYTPDLVAGVWAGNNDNSSMSSQAADIAAPIWHSFMTSALAGTPVHNWTAPTGIKQVTLDADTGRLPLPGAKNLRTDIFASWYKPLTAADTKSAQVDKVSGKLATNCTPPAAIETVYSSQIQAEIPPSDPSFALWNPPVQALAASLGYAQGGGIPTTSDDVHHCSDTPPSVQLTASDTGGGAVQLTINVSNGQPFTVNQLQLSMDNQAIPAPAVNGSGTYTTTYQVPSNGQHTFKAVVTDTGLYQGSDQTTLNINDASGGGGQTISGTSPTNGETITGVGPVNFSWTSVSGANQYRIFVSGPTSTNQTVSGTSTSIALAPGDYTWYVEALDSNGSVIGNPSSIDSFTYKLH